MGGFDALDYRRIKQGDAGKLGNYPILSVLPDKFARFLFELHGFRFESLDLPLLPADRSDFDVHGAREDDKVPYLAWYVLLVYIISIKPIKTIIRIIGIIYVIAII